MNCKDMNFSAINNQFSIKKPLIEQVRSGRIPHAQLFSGQSGGDALALAVAYARYLLCTNRGDEDVCEECPTCYRTRHLEHPDLHFVFPVNSSKLAKATGRSDQKPVSDQFIELWRKFVIDNNAHFTENEWYSYIDIENKQGNINKEEANELLRKLSLKSYEGGYKVVIIYLPERMNDASANTLLKLVEEPPQKTLFLFVTEQADSIISTIRSRVQEIVVPNSVQSSVVSSARAEEFFTLFTSLMRKAYMGKYVELFDFVDEIAGIGRESHRAFVEYSVEMLRYCYLHSIGGCEMGLISIDGMRQEVQGFIRNFSPFVNHLTIEELIAEFEQVGRQVKMNGNPKIIFSHFALTVSKIIINGKRKTAAGE